MSAAQPGELRALLIKALHVPVCVEVYEECGEVADALLPVVTAYAERVARERAAEELRAAADWLAGEGPDGSLPGGSAPDRTSGGLSWLEHVGDRDAALDWCQMSLADRAAALTADDQPVQP